MKYALGVEYLGAVAHGWQSQLDNQTSIQTEIEKALAKVANQKINLSGSGRTDAGVNATMQVAHFESGATRTANQWLCGANSLLPAEIRVKWVQPITSDFHARYSAIKRTYCYVIYNHTMESTFWKHRALWYYRTAVDEMKLQQMSNVLVGSHDFSSFRASKCQAASPVREIYEIKVERIGKIVTITLIANGFLQKMVRNIVGALLIFHRKYGTDQAVCALQQILIQRDRTQAPDTIASHGLYYLGPEYSHEYKLPGPRTLFDALGFENSLTSANQK